MVCVLGVPLRPVNCVAKTKSQYLFVLLKFDHSDVDIALDLERVGHSIGRAVTEFTVMLPIDFNLVKRESNNQLVTYDICVLVG